MSITINDYPVLNGNLLLPSTGVWFFNGEIDANSDIGILNSAALISDGINTFTGSITQSSYAAGRCSLFIVGGKDKLEGNLPSKSFSASSFKARVEQTISEIGEEIGSLEIMDNQQIQKWVRIEGTGFNCLTSLTKLLNYKWRMNFDGEIDVFKSEISIPYSGKLVELSRSKNTIDFGIDDLSLHPNHLISARVIDTAHYRITTNNIRVKGYLQ